MGKRDARRDKDREKKREMAWLKSPATGASYTLAGVLERKENNEGERKREREEYRERKYYSVLIKSFDVIYYTCFAVLTTMTPSAHDVQYERL